MEVKTISVGPITNFYAIEENGKTMLPAIRDCVRSSRRAEEMGLDIQGVVKGTLTIGSYFSVSSMWSGYTLCAAKRTISGGSGDCDTVL